MIKLYITAIDSKEDGTAVTLFEDYLLGYEDKEAIALDEELAQKLSKRVEESEAIFNNVEPF